MTVQHVKQSEGTAARRRFYFHALDNTDGTTELTGLTGIDVRVNKNGAGYSVAGGTVTEQSLGTYYYEATAAELDTLGMLRIRLTKSGMRTYIVDAQVVPWDPYSPVIQIDLTQSISVSPTLGTVGEALAGARADALGRYVLSGDTITRYAHDGTTVLETFTLAPSGGPFTSRTPT